MTPDITPTCGPDSCTDPAPASPSYTCADGTTAGPICGPTSDGLCGWSITHCPVEIDDPPIVCNDCDGEAPDGPSQLCKDGTVAGPTCVATTWGPCVWIVTQCPIPQPADCTVVGCAADQYCETVCYPCDAPDPETPCDSFTCQSTCVPL